MCLCCCFTEKVCFSILFQKFLCFCTGRKLGRCWKKMNKQKKQKEVSPVAKTVTDMTTKKEKQNKYKIQTQKIKLITVHSFVVGKTNKTNKTPCCIIYYFSFCVFLVFWKKKKIMIKHFSQMITKQQTKIKWKLNLKFL